MDAFLIWIESSALGQSIRTAGPSVYAAINLAHILGIGALFGAVLIIDLRLLGLRRDVPLAPLARAAEPIAKAGFALAALAGIGMLATNGSEYIGNLFLLIKFPAIGIGLVNVAVLNRSAAWRAAGSRALTPAEDRQLAVMGGVSLTCWLTAVSAGRLIAYW